MKNKIYRPIICALFLLGCHNATNKAPSFDDDYKAIKGAEQCFVAVFQKDSATVKFKTMPNGKVLGKLVISYGEPEPLAVKKDFYHGTITGRFTKDTLFADYNFTDDTAKTLYRNPIALLKKDDKLMLGVGAIVTYLGRSYFLNHRAINFDKSRFQFEGVGCGVGLGVKGSR